MLLLTTAVLESSRIFSTASLAERLKRTGINTLDPSKVKRYKQAVVSKLRSQAGVWGRLWFIPTMYFRVLGPLTFFSGMLAAMASAAFGIAWVSRLIANTMLGYDALPTIYWLLKWASVWGVLIFVVSLALMVSLAVLDYYWAGEGSENFAQAAAYWITLELPSYPGGEGLWPQGMPLDLKAAVNKAVALRGVQLFVEEIVTDPLLFARQGREDCYLGGWALDPELKRLLD